VHKLLCLFLSLSTNCSLYCPPHTHTQQEQQQEEKERENCVIAFAEERIIIEVR